MASRETGKQKAARIPLDYYRRPDRLQHRKLVLSLAGLVLAACWSAWGMYSPATHHSPGQLAAVHATWDNQCAACHVSFTPIRDDSWAASTDATAAADRLCTRCHQGAMHHSAQLSSDLHGCASCHIDHRGRQTSLVQVANDQCTRCHAELTQHMTKPSTLSSADGISAAQITRFDTEHHPRFRSILSDPGHLKFSHRRHLAPGLNFGAEDRFPPWLWRNIDAPADRDRLGQGEASLTDSVQLNCTSCHQLEAKDPSRLATAQRPDGANFLPITYENQCKACHKLSFDPDSKGSPASTLLPHGLQPVQIGEYLKMAYSRMYLEARPKLLDQFVRSRPLPNQEQDAESKQARVWIDERVQQAAKFLSGRCGECHQLDDLPTKTPVAATTVPEFWLTHARFDHSAHRAVQCQVCHQAEYLYRPWRADESPPRLDNADVLIPQIDTCVQCHAPKGAHGTGGARTDCVECHAYHGGDSSSSKLYNRSRPIGSKLDLDDFLRGVPVTGR